jgi:hypothetical protein
VVFPFEPFFIVFLLSIDLHYFEIGILGYWVDEIMGLID